MTLDLLEAKHSRRIQQIAEHRDGVLLFVEELSRAVLDTKLETQMGEAKRIAPLGAVMGR